MERFDAIVVGAGAAGMFCAAMAGQAGRRVLLLDNGQNFLTGLFADFIAVIEYPGYGGDGNASSFGNVFNCGHDGHLHSCFYFDIN